MGSAAIGIPIGAPVATSPLETLAIPYARSSIIVQEVEMNDGGIVGKLQVKLMVPFPPFIFVFFQN